MRFLLSLLGLAILGFFVVFGVIAAAVLLAVGGVFLLVRQWKASRRPSMHRPHDRGTASPDAGSSSQHDVLEGEFVVVDQEHTRH